MSNNRFFSNPIRAIFLLIMVVITMVYLFTSCNTYKTLEQAKEHSFYSVGDTIIIDDPIGYIYPETPGIIIELGYDSTKTRYRTAYLVKFFNIHTTSVDTMVFNEVELKHFNQ